VISPGAVATELPNTITESDVAAGINAFYEAIAICTDPRAKRSKLASVGRTSLPGEASPLDVERRKSDI
jgi:hypothetical protein